MKADDINIIKYTFCTIYFWNNSARRNSVVFVVGGIELFSEDVAIHYINRKIYTKFRRIKRTYSYTQIATLFIRINLIKLNVKIFGVFD